MKSFVFSPEVEEQHLSFLKRSILTLEAKVPGESNCYASVMKNAQGEFLTKVFFETSDFTISSVVSEKDQRESIDRALIKLYKDLQIERLRCASTQ